LTTASRLSLVVLAEPRGRLEPAAAGRATPPADRAACRAAMNGVLRLDGSSCVPHVE
jgi:hypothetical protein